MVGEKVLFFDIDGTLVNFDTTIPTSTIEALRLARENGHKLFLCTGRSLGQLQQELQSFHFEGGVLAAGACIRYQNKIIDSVTMSKEKMQKVWSFIDEEDLPYIVQCGAYTATQRGKKDTLIEVLTNRYGVVEHQMASVTANMRLVEDRSEITHVEKVLYYNSSYSPAEVQCKVGKEFDVVPMTFLKGGMTSGEITQADVNKAYGMEKLLTFLGKTREDAIAFGDGLNDIEMLQYAGIGVAMGNADKTVKDAADMVTASINQDGIFLALQKLNII